MLTALEPLDGEAILPLDEAKAHLRVVDDSEDASIAAYRDAAVDWVERNSGIALAPRQFRWDDRQFVHAFRFPVRPVVSVDAVAYDDSAGVEVSLAEADWRFGGDMLHPAAGTRWPYAYGSAGSVRITFTAGHATPPPGLVAAVKLMLGHLFAQREGVSVGNIVTEVPLGVMSLCDQHRAPGL